MTARASAPTTIGVSPATVSPARIRARQQKTITGMAIRLVTQTSSGQASGKR